MWTRHFAVLLFLHIALFLPRSPLIQEESDLVPDLRKDCSWLCGRPFNNVAALRFDFFPSGAKYANSSSTSHHHPASRHSIDPSRWLTVCYDASGVSHHPAFSQTYADLCHQQISPTCQWESWHLHIHSSRLQCPSQWIPNEKGWSLEINIRQLEISRRKLIILTHFPLSVCLSPSISFVHRTAAEYPGFWRASWGGKSWRKKKSKWIIRHSLL